MTIKWTRPFDGACKQTVINGARYVIINDREDEYYLAAYPNEEKEMRKFNTWRALYRFMTGRDATTTDEDKVYNDIRLIARATSSANYRTFTKDGAEWVLYEPMKRIWRLLLPERISQTFYTERDAVEWATAWLEKAHEQTTVFDLLERGGTGGRCIHWRVVYCIPGLACFADLRGRNRCDLHGNKRDPRAGPRNRRVVRTGTGAEGAGIVGADQKRKVDRMKLLIDAEDAIERIQSLYMKVSPLKHAGAFAAGYNNGIRDAIDAIDETSTVERELGEWTHRNSYWHTAICSNCNKETMFEERDEEVIEYDYCPHCGARMKGADDE